MGLFWRGRLEGAVFFWYMPTQTRSRSVKIVAVLSSCFAFGSHSLSTDDFQRFAYGIYQEKTTVLAECEKL